MSSAGTNKGRPVFRIHEFESFDERDDDLDDRLNDRLDEEEDRAALSAPPMPRRAVETVAGAEGRIVGLLDQLGQRLKRSEDDRLALRQEVREYRDMMATLEERAEQIEQTQKKHQEVITRADAMAEKLENALLQQNRLNRRLEKIVQDRARMIQKLERIEETVIETQQAVNANALVALNGGQSGKKLPVTTETDDDEKPWWATFANARMAASAAAVVVLMIAGWAVTQINVTKTPTEDKTEVAANVSLDQDLKAPEPEDTALQSAPAIEEPVPDTNAMLAEMEENPQAVGEALNAIEPSTIQATKLPDPVEVKPAVAKEPIKEEVAFTQGQEPDLKKPVEKVVDVKPVPTPKIAASPPPPSTEDFIKSQKNASPLSERMKPDSALPAPIKEIEIKAFSGVPEAQHDLAAIYTAGHGGVTVDYDRAVFWFKEAATSGVANAQYNLGVLYQQGLGVPKDIPKTVQWYRAAAKKNHPEAQYNLGIASIEGIGTPYDAKQAAVYFENAANAGIMEAGYNLGLIHENGLLGDPTPKEAIYWYNKAAESGSPEAKAALNQLAKAMGYSEAEVERIYKDFDARQKRSSAGEKQAAAKPSKPAAVPKKAEVAPPPAPPPSEPEALLADDAPIEVKQVADTIVDTTQNGDQDAAMAELIESVPKLSMADLEGPGGASPAVSAKTDESDVSYPVSDQSTVAQIQEQLIKRGMFPGPVDGLQSPQVEDAIRSYQLKNGLSPDGRPTQALLVHLLSGGGSPKTAVR
jgi:TPR repeat protein